MIVRLRKAQLDYFRRKARETTNEIFAVLVGRVINPNLVEVERFEYPELDFQDANGVTPNIDSITEIEHHAEQEGLHSLGSIHSHPNAPPVMSETDYNSHRASNDKISGIVEVTNRKTRVVFWQDGTPLKCKFEYY